MEPKQQIMQRPMVNGVSLMTSLIVDRLSQGKPGDVITDNDLFTITNLDCSVGGRGYPNLQSAINIVLREKSIVWERVRKTGMLKCLKSPEVAMAVSRGVTRIRKATARVIRKSNAVNIEELPRNQQAEFLGKQSQLLALHSMASGKKMLCVETK